ncbi:MAG: HAD-IB family phosphatase [Thermoplasmata archaeon]|nr:MAG: HAD-IB family phosphatase [Thermoplasmata archaeon]
MKYKFIAFDLDGVLVDTFSSWVWMHKHFNVNNDESLYAYQRGEIDYAEFMRRDIALWLEKKKDMTINDVEEILSSIPLVKGAKEVVAELKEYGVKTAIISCGIEVLANRVAKKFGIDFVVANGLVVDEDGRLTGEGTLSIELADKGKPLRKLLLQNSVKKEESAAIGNSYGDAAMFDVCGFGIAFNPQDDITREKADLIIQGDDLRGILPFIQVE